MLLKLGIELVEGSFKEEFGFTLDQVSSLYQSACIPCGVFKETTFEQNFL